MALRSSKTNVGFPGIVASYGQPNPPGVAAGMARYWGGGDVIWVGNRSDQKAGTGYSPNDPMSSPLTALAALNGSTSRGHVIFVNPGSSFSVDVADWASATGAANATAIVGLGIGTSKPAFTWTAAGSTWLLDTANFAIDGCRLFLAGANAAGSALTVAAPFTGSAPGCVLRNNDIFFGFDADQIVTIGIALGTASDDFVFENNTCIGETAAECTTFMDINGCDRMIMRNNYIAGATSSTTVGIVRHVTTASLNIQWENNTFINRKAVSAHAVTGLAGVSGVSKNDTYMVLDTSTTTPWGTSPGIMGFKTPAVVNTAGEIGGLGTVISN